ncbi:MAG TPA: glycosyltransferase [Burkholderiaceae bacterium]|nr:glycosyltransferase [Burkholderiaceae bacterium]
MNQRRDNDIGVIAVVPDAWDSVWTTRHHLLRRVARRWPVVWLEPAAGWRDYWRPDSARFMHSRQFYSPLPGLEVLTPGMFDAEFYKPAIARRVALRLRYTAAARRLCERGVRRIVLYIWRDAFAEALEHTPHHLSCYHIDDEYTFSDVDLPVSPREANLIRRVDQVFVHSRTLFAKKGSLNANTTLVPNGVDYSAFVDDHPEPADLAAIEHPRIGCIGVVKRQLDLARLTRLARARRDWSFVMIGPRGQLAGKQDDFEALSAEPNVHMLGGRPATSLPAYAQHLDVGLMPYENNGYTRYIDPLKLKEYLAAGLPVVATPIDAVKAYADVVARANDDTQWLNAIEHAIAHRRDPVAIHARRARASRYDWDLLARRVTDTIEHRLAGMTGPALAEVEA